MKINEIIENLNELKTQHEAGKTLVFRISEPTSILSGYIGLNDEKSIIFIVESSNEKLSSFSQNTKNLRFNYNIHLDLIIDGEKIKSIVHEIICNSNEKDDILVFLELSSVFLNSIDVNDPYKMIALFNAYVNLFSQTRRASEIELQGLYSEIFVIDYFSSIGLDLLNFWQKKEKMKFDFSITDLKKLEIKSTLKEERIHHFKHEQLLSNIYDIVVISIKMRKDDQGFSLNELIERIKSIDSIEFQTLLYLANFTKNYTKEELSQVQFDLEYSKLNIKIFNSNEIPKFSGYQPEGVSRTEYDSDLSSTKSIDVEKFTQWVMEA